MAGVRDSMNVESLQIQARSVSWQPVEVKLEIVGACCVFKSAFLSLAMEMIKW